MRTSAKGIELLKRHEGLRLEAYPDPGTGGEPWTIGYGTTHHSIGPGMKITASAAEVLLINALHVFERIVDSAVHIELTQNQFDALVSLVYNIGAHNFLGSTVLRRLNNNDVAGAAEAFLMWNKAGRHGHLHVMEGLTQRRKDERDLFLTS